MVSKWVWRYRWQTRLHKLCEAFNKLNKSRVQVTKYGFFCKLYLVRKITSCPYIGSHRKQIKQKFLKPFKKSRAQLLLRSFLDNLHALESHYYRINGKLFYTDFSNNSTNRNYCYEKETCSLGERKITKNKKKLHTQSAKPRKKNVSKTSVSRKKKS